MTKQYTEHLELVLDESDDTIPFKPDYQETLNKLDAHAATVDSALNEVEGAGPAIAAEAAARAQADSVINQALQSETLTRQTQVSQLQAAATAEVTARTQGDTSTLASAVAQAATAATSALATETTARIAGDNTLTIAVSGLTTGAAAEVATRTSQVAAINAALPNKADLVTVNGQKVLNPAQLPAINLGGNLFPVDSEAEMLALSQAVKGDLARRSDLGGQTFYLNDVPASTLANWQQFSGDFALNSDLDQEVSDRSAGDIAVASSAATDASTKAATAQSTAISTASTDATTKANAAQASAISTASTDATTKAASAQSAAISAASTDASAKASAAQTAAISAAATDATTKSNAAQANAITTAGSDATTKALAAQTNAQASSLQKGQNLSDLTNAATGRTNLGLGTAATQASSAFEVAGAASAAQASAAVDATSKANTARDAAVATASTDATNKVATETTARQNADAAIGTSITNEVTRATGAEATVAASVTAEATARQTADALKVDKAPGSSSFKVYEGPFASAPNDSYVLDPDTDAAIPVDVAGGYASYNGLQAALATKLSRSAQQYSLADPQWGCKADAQYQLSGASISAGSNVVNITSDRFSNADVGKTIVIARAGTATLTSRPNRDLATTITQVNGPRSVQISVAATASVSNAEFGFGTDNTSGIRNAITTLSATGGGTLVVPPGNWGMWTIFNSGTGSQNLSLATPYVTIQGNGDSSRFVSSQNVYEDSAVFFLTGDDITFDSLSVEFYTSLQLDEHAFVRHPNGHTIRLGDVHFNPHGYYKKCRVSNVTVRNSRNCPIWINGYSLAHVSENVCEVMLGGATFFGNIRNGFKVLNNIFRYGGDDMIFYYSGDGNAELANGVVISGNTCEYAYAKCVGISGVRNCVVSNNTFRYTWASAVRINEESNFGFLANQNVIVANNTVDYAGTYFGPGQYKTSYHGSAYGIEAGSHLDEDLCIRGNTITNSYSHGIQIFGGYVIVDNNRIVNIGGQGINVGNPDGPAAENAKSLSVTGNRIENTSASGINMGQARNVKVSNNTIVGFNDRGIWYGYVNDAVFENNTLIDTKVSSTAGIGERPSSVNTQVTRNNNPRLKPGDGAPSGAQFHLDTRIITYGSAAPTTGKWTVGSIVFNNTPVAGAPQGWICSVAGSPGTWIQFGQIGSISASAQGVIKQRTAAGTYITTPGSGTGSFTPANNRQYLIPVALSSDVTATSLVVNVGTAGEAGSVVRLGIYADTGAPAPGSLILDAGTVSTATTGAKAISISQALTAGTYWLSAVVQLASTTPPVMSAITGNVLGVAATSTALSNSNAGYSVDGQSGVFANPVPGFSSNNACIKIAVGV